MKPQTIYLVLVVLLVLTGCRSEAPTPVAVAVEATAVPTAVPTNTATPQPTDTAVPTDTPSPTFTFTPSATTLPLLVVSVLDETGAAPLPDSQVLLDDASSFHAEQIVTAAGQATFADLSVGRTYTVTVKAAGFTAPHKYAKNGAKNDKFSHKSIRSWIQP